MSVDAHAAASWGADATGYERARPGWPAEAVDWLFEHLDLDHSSTVLDLAAGTGKLTRLLVGRAGRVVAVEPLAGMREQLARTTPDAEVLEGHAEALPLEPRSVDAVLVAEAFHWFASPATLAEIQRVLRPGAGLGLLWNLEVLGEPVVAAIESALPPAVAEARMHPTPRATWDVVGRSPAFGEPVQARFAHDHPLDADGVAELVCSWSRVASRPADERSTIAERLRAALPDGARLRYEALAVVARLTTV